MLRFKWESTEKPSVLRTPNMKYSILSELAEDYGQAGFSFKYVDALFLYSRYCSMKTNTNIFKASGSYYLWYQNSFFFYWIFTKTPKKCTQSCFYILAFWIFNKILGEGRTGYSKQTEVAFLFHKSFKG